MPATDRRRWQLVSGHFGRAVRLSGRERSDYLATLLKRTPDVAAELQELLDAHETALQEGFLEDRPAVPDGGGLAVGQAVGAYRLLAPIGQGGMGSVWLAERTDGRFQRKAAIKFVRASLVGRGSEQRFRREGVLLAQLTHPHIAQLIDAGVTDRGQAYLVLEYVDGDPIDRYCDARQLGIEARLALFLDVLAAVSDAHAHLIVHRDLKPSNVLVTPDGQVKLLDFGIAKLVEDRDLDDALLTKEGGWALTPEYAAPEQVTGGAISTVTDVYTLGVLLYVLLSGRHPAGNATRTPAGLVKAVVDGAPPPLSQAFTAHADDRDAAAVASLRSTTPDRLRTRLTGDVDTIVRKALKKAPAERYASVSAFADDLRRYLHHEPISARPDSMAYRSGKFVRRNRAAVALASVALLAIVAGIAATLQQSRSAQAERDYALRQLARAEALNDLNRFLLTDAAPSGQPVNVAELLARAERILARQTAGRNETRADLLVAIGHQYRLLDEPDHARRTLETAVELVRTSPDPSIRARAACALGATLAAVAQLPRAAELVHAGLSVLPDETRFTLDRVFCLLRSSEVARAGGATTFAIAEAEQARLLLDRYPFHSEIQDLRVMMDVAESYSQAGRHGAAIAAFERAAALMASLGRDRTQTAGTLFNNWALSLSAAGRPRDASAVYRQAIDVSRAGGTDAAVSPMLLVNYGRALRELDRLDEAARYAEAGHDKGRSAGFEVLVNQSLILRGGIYRERGELDRAAAMFAEVEPRLHRALPPGHVAFAALMLEQAYLAHARGDLNAALALIDRACAIAQAALRTGGTLDTSRRALIARAELRNAAGHHAAAAADARLALRQLQDMAAPEFRSSLRGDAYLALAESLGAPGQADASRPARQAALEEARKHLEDAVGTDHLGARRARGLLDPTTRTGIQPVQRHSASAESLNIP